MKEVSIPGYIIQEFNDFGELQDMRFEVDGIILELDEEGNQKTVEEYLPFTIEPYVEDLEK